MFWKILNFFVSRFKKIRNFFEFDYKFLFWVLLSMVIFKYIIIDTNLLSSFWYFFFNNGQEVVTTPPPPLSYNVYSHSFIFNPNVSPSSQTYLEFLHNGGFQIYTYHDQEFVQQGLDFINQHPDLELRAAALSSCADVSVVVHDVPPVVNQEPERILGPVLGMLINGGIALKELKELVEPIHDTFYTGPGGMDN